MNSGGTRSQEGIESLKHWRWLKECDFKNKHSSCFELFRRSLYISTVTRTWTPWGKKAKRRIKLCRGEELKLTSVEPPSTRVRQEAGRTRSLTSTGASAAGPALVRPCQETPHACSGSKEPVNTSTSLLWTCLPRLQAEAWFLLTNHFYYYSFEFSGITQAHQPLLSFSLESNWPQACSQEKLL